MNGKYLALSGRIRQELEELTIVVRRVERIWEQAGRSSDDYYVDATALNLHGFYAGLERIFELIADDVDQAKPDGAHWHQNLLRQMPPRCRECGLRLSRHNYEISWTSIVVFVMSCGMCIHTISTPR